MEINKLIIVLCIILAYISCQEKENMLDIDDTFVIDMTGEPDKVVENVVGTLYYYKELKLWSFSHGFPGTIDSEDRYLIAEMPDGEFPFKEGAQLSINGLCYKIQDYMLHDRGVFFPAGVEYYFIKITDLK